MKGFLVILPIIITLLLGTIVMPLAFAQFQSGGVDKEGIWHSSEGLKHGDYFSYSMCHVHYKECAQFKMNFWIEGDVEIGSETQWLAKVVVYDGSKVVVGNLTLGKVDAIPTGGSDESETSTSNDELKVYRNAFKSSIVWLSAFASSNDSSGGKGPKEFSAISWGKIGNIGGEQVVPQAIETVTVPAGTWETVQVGWKSGGIASKIWIADDFPFPIKAKTYTHVSQGIPPPEYVFSLLEYRENVQTDPFVGIVSSTNESAALGCETDFTRDGVLKKSTVNFAYQVHVFYGPSDPVQNCDMQWLIKFIRVYNDTDFLSQVQFDFFVVDDDLKPTRSISQEEGRPFLYSPSGQYQLDMIVREPPGTVNYAIWIYGLAPEGIVPSTPVDYLIIPITVFAGDALEPVSIDNSQPLAASIPAWIKNNAGWWAEGSIDDNSFIQGIKFLIKEKVIKIPPTSQGSSSGSDIPAWVKNNAGWWAEGSIDDNSFIQGIQFLIERGIITLS